MVEYFVSWWNLENLFDVEGSRYRSKRLQESMKKELKKWDDKVLDKKISQLAKVISKMNSGKGPDILGICEVENRAVIQRLVDSLRLPRRDYDIAHADTEDKRGIDIAFIYDSKKFDLNETFSHIVLKRSPTRDIFQINLRIQKSKRLLIVIGNHWPSRLGGQVDSEPYRMTAGETLSYWNERIEKTYGDEVHTVILGDFNDEPYNSSLTKYALSTPSITEVLKSKSPKIYNLMWPLMGNGIGTHFHEHLRMLDQIMVSRGFLLKGSALRIKKDSVSIIRYPEMVDKKDPYGKPIRFGRPSTKMNENGFSDHFPISVILEE